MCTDYKNNIRKERRRFARLNVNVNVDYEVLPRHKQQKHVSSKNISTGGICVILKEPLEPETIIGLDIGLPEEAGKVTATGRIVWIQEFSIGEEAHKRYEAGVEFTDISDEDRQKVEQCVFSLHRIS